MTLIIIIQLMLIVACAFNILIFLFFFSSSLFIFYNIFYGFTMWEKNYDYFVILTWDDINIYDLWRRKEVFKENYYSFIFLLWTQNFYIIWTRKILWFNDKHMKVRHQLPRYLGIYMWKYLLNKSNYKWF